MNSNNEDYTCSLCFEIFKYPVTLPCKHVFCKACLDGHLENNTLSCPLCRARIQCWLRKLKLKKENIVDLKLWEEVKKMFPERTDNEGNLNQKEYKDMKIKGEILGLIPLAKVKAELNGGAHGEFHRLFEKAINEADDLDDDWKGWDDPQPRSYCQNRIEAFQLKMAKEPKYVEPPLTLAKPGEIRQYYEESLEQEREERRKEEENNFSLSKNLIKIIEEDLRKEEEERLKQLKIDEELARSLLSEEEPQNNFSDEEARLRQLKADEELAKMLASTSDLPRRRCNVQSQHGSSVKNFFQASVKKRTPRKERLPNKKVIDIDDTDNEEFNRAECSSPICLPHNSTMLKNPATADSGARLRQLKADEELAKMLASTSDLPRRRCNVRSQHGSSVKNLFQAAVRKRTPRKERLPNKKVVDTDDTDSRSYADSEEFNRALECDSPVFLGPVFPKPWDSVSISSTESEIPALPKKSTTLEKPTTADPPSIPMEQQATSSPSDPATGDPQSSIPKEQQATLSPSDPLTGDPQSSIPQEQQATLSPSDPLTGDHLSSIPKEHPPPKPVSQSRVCSPYNSPSTSGQKCYSNSRKLGQSETGARFKLPDYAIPSTSKDTCSEFKDVENAGSATSISISHGQLSLFAPVGAQASETEIPKERDADASRCSSGADSIGQELHHFRPITTSPTTLTNDGQLPQLVVPQSSNVPLNDERSIIQEPDPETLMRCYMSLKAAKDRQIEEDRRLAEELDKQWQIERKRVVKKVITEYNLRPKERAAVAAVATVPVSGSRKRKRSSGNLRKKVLVDRTQSTLDKMLINSDC